VAEMLQRMDSRELAEWMAFFELEGPFGIHRGDWQSAQIVAMLAEVNRDKKKHRKPYKVEDFLLKFEPAVKAPEAKADQLLRKVEALNLALGGRDLRPKENIH